MGGPASTRAAGATRAFHLRSKSYAGQDTGQDAGQVVRRRQGARWFAVLL